MKSIKELAQDTIPRAPHRPSEPSLDGDRCAPRNAQSDWVLRHPVRQLSPSARSIPSESSGRLPFPFTVARGHRRSPFLVRRKCCRPSRNNHEITEVVSGRRGRTPHHLAHATGKVHLGALRTSDGSAPRYAPHTVSRTVTPPVANLTRRRSSGAIHRYVARLAYV